MPCTQARQAQRVVQGRLGGDGLPVCLVRLAVDGFDVLANETGITLRILAANPDTRRKLMPVWLPMPAASISVCHILGLSRGAREGASRGRGRGAGQESGSLKSDLSDE